jgi:putative sterol carrier protein
LRTSHILEKIVEVEAHIDVVTCGAQTIEATFGDFFSDKDPGHCNHRYRQIRPVRKELNDLFTWLADGYLEPTPYPSRALVGGGPMSYPFLSAEWMDAAKAIREKYADQSSEITISVRMNQVITDVPFGDGDVKLYLDTSSGKLEMESGELETPDLTLTTDYDTAKKIFVDQDQAAGMQAFMAGKIKVQGDMMKMMAMQTGMPQDDIAKTIATEIKDITD